MSLTRDEWVEMWKCIKKLENHTQVKNGGIYNKIDRKIDIDTIKVYIQSVIGQME